MLLQFCSSIYANKNANVELDWNKNLDVKLLINTAERVTKNDAESGSLLWSRTASTWRLKASIGFF